MKNFKIKYTGQSRQLTRLSGEIIEAETEREAVENFYQRYFETDYFPQEDGSIQNANGDTIADATDTAINYDSDYIRAEEIKPDDML